MPIPLAVAGTPPGKTHARGSIRDWSDDDSEDCVLLEVLNPPPISFAYTLPSTSVDPDGQVQDVQPVAVGGQAPAQKRAGAGTSDTGATAPPAKRKKVVKKPGSKGPRKPTSTG